MCSYYATTPEFVFEQALSGIVRPEDVTPDNTVASWRIVDARIDFKGDGILARKQSPGLLTKLFDLFGLN